MVYVIIEKAKLPSGLVWLFLSAMKGGEGMVIKKQITFILCFALLSTGCATPINPKISPVKPGMIPEYWFNESVSVVNVQTAETVRVQDTLWEINLKETTDVAVDLIKWELSNRGFLIRDNANKVLEIIMSDVRVGLAAGGFGHKCTMVLKVRSGNGYYKYYEEYNVGWLPSNCDFTITKTVAAMLSDEGIINYLKNK